MKCTVEMEGMKFILTNPLFLLPPYRTPLMLAAAAAMILNVDPTPLNHFTALPGRMSSDMKRISSLSTMPTAGQMSRRRSVPPGMPGIAPGRAN